MTDSTFQQAILDKLTKIEESIFENDGIKDRLARLEERFAMWARISMIVVAIVSVLTEHVLSQTWNRAASAHLISPVPVLNSKRGK